MQLPNRLLDIRESRSASLDETKPLLGLLDAALPPIGALNRPDDLNAAGETLIYQGSRYLPGVLGCTGSRRDLDEFGIQEECASGRGWDLFVGQSRLYRRVLAIELQRVQLHGLAGRMTLHLAATLLEHSLSECVLEQ